MKPAQVFLFACLVVTANAASDKDWQDFKKAQKKQYKTTDEEKKARANFDANDNAVRAHNAKYAAGTESYEIGHNELSDLSVEEYRATRCNARVNGIQRILKSVTGEELQLSSFVSELRQTSSVDYSTAYCMTPVKNQGQCGSCYAFSAVAALEFYNCKKTKTKKIFSEQQFVDCSSAYGNQACNGGFYSHCYDYMIKKSFGVASSSSYPYVAKNQTCKYVSTMKAGTVASYKWSLPQGNESVMMTAFLAAKGPVNVAIDAGLSSFQLYKSGVYNDAQCSTSVNHAVLVVGYGTVNGTNYWKIKNSWGTGWGMKGYMLMGRGENRCGIADYVLYPVV